MEKAGEETAKLHDNNIIHGDLTTSNMILKENSKNNNVKPCKPNKLNKIIKADNQINNLSGDNKLIIDKDTSDKFSVYIIDFGLGFISPKIEDKAVDLHLIKQALEAKHFKFHSEPFSSFLEGYNPKDKDKILKQLEKVEQRGRYKH
jgi:tRNA A-37 threonylcarbamoyl transferase component Bud32